MKRVALLVGVEKYRDPGITPLAYAGADVLALGDRLSRVCGFDRVEVLAQSEGYDRPDSHNALRRFDELCAELDEDDLFLFYFSGHGVEWKREAADPDQKPRMYLLTEDTFKTRPYQNSLSRELLSDALGNLAARRRILLFDACRNHPEKGKGDADNRMAEAVARDTAALAREAAVSGATTALYSACGQGKRSYEYCWRVGNREEGNGVFTHFLLEGLDGAAWRNDELEFRSLVDHTSRNVRDWTRRMPGFREPQEPWYEEFGAGEQIVLAGREEKYTRKGKPAGGRVVILEPPRLHIATRPAGARVWVDGKLSGQSPVSVELAAGEHTVRAELAGFAPWERRIRFDGRGDAPLDVALVALPKGPQPGEVRTFAGGEFAWIPPGTFQMGSRLSPEEVIQTYGGDKKWVQYHVREHPRHAVTLTHGFWLATKEVTVAEFRAFADTAGYKTDAEKGGSGWTYSFEKDSWEDTKGASWRNPGWAVEDRQPVVLVSWNDAVAYCAWLSQKAGEAYRLPTEAQWEYACRAGTETEFWFGDRAEDGRGCLNGADETRLPTGGQWNYRFPFEDGYWNVSPVGSFKASPWGLYDMHGNVWEWCSDWYAEDYYGHSAGQDPENMTKSDYKVLRGGAWYGDPGRCRSAFRSHYTPATRLNLIGFRLLRTP